MHLYEEITQCRVCQSPQVANVIDLGEQYLASSFVKSNQEAALAETKVPLRVALCQDCGLLQLRETVQRDALFRDYFYRSGINPMMSAALQEVAQAVLTQVDLKPGDAVLDIGCNDCTLLAMFPPSAIRVGIDPATNINREGLDPSITVMSDYFSAPAVLQATAGRQYQVVTSIAMLYSVEDVKTFVAGVKAVLAQEGVWCIQLSYLPAILQSMSFYDICHEHLYYFSLTSLQALLARYGLSIIDASTNSVNGGSVRVFVKHQGQATPASAALQRLLEEEHAMRLLDAATYERFFHDICEVKRKVTTYIQQEKAQGHRVLGLGASTKGNVLLQFFGLDKHLVPYISERNPEKVGLRTLGTDIELVAEETARDFAPSCMLVLIWFFKEELIRREQAYLAQGGTLLFPMPYCHLVTKDGEVRV